MFGLILVPLDQILVLFELKLEFLGHFPVRLGPKPVLPKSKVKNGIY